MGTSPGTYITFAGVDGAGKTTQARLLTDYLVGLGYRAKFVPNESLAPLRALLDRIAVDKGMTDHQELLGVETLRLIAAVLKWHSLRSLTDALARRGDIVIADRGVVCQYAVARYFGAANEWLVRQILRDLPQPAATLYLELSGEEASRRVQQRGIDYHTPHELDALAAAYRVLPEFSHFFVVSASEPVAVVQQAIRAVLSEALPSLAGLTGEGLVAKGQQP